MFRGMALACARSIATIGLLAFALASAPAQAAPIDVGAPTSDWTAVDYPSLIPDYSDDQQTGLNESDIVGNSTDPALYIHFDGAGTPSTTDGTFYYRVRVSADSPAVNPNGFRHFFAFGLDADLDGALDLFLGVDNSGSTRDIGIFDPGTGLNVSPDTTSIISTPIQRYDELSSNYDFSPVDATIDPTATTFDVDGADNDYFLSYAIPFQDIVNALIAKGIAFDEDSSFQMVAGTSTQANALNQDLGGPDGGTSSTETWAALGAITGVISATNLAPEPSSGALFALGLVILVAAKRQR
jgi:hypothetical protein